MLLFEGMSEREKVGMQCVVQSEKGGEEEEEEEGRRIILEELPSER